MVPPGTQTNPAKSHAHAKILAKVPHGTKHHHPHAARQADEPHGSGRRSDMAEETKLTEGAGAEPHGEEDDIDYKALYEQEKAHSRKWEKQAKANKSAAEELAKAQEAGKTAEEQIAQLTKRLDEKEKAEARSKIAAKVAQEKGVSADLLVGDDEESMSEYADRMLKFFKKQPAPKVEKPGKFDHGDGNDDSELRDFARKLLGKE